jgi:cysteine dioxygenase
MTTMAAPLPRREMTSCPPAVFQPLFDELAKAEGPIDLDRLEALVGALRVTPDELGEAINIDTAAYVRTLVFENPHVAVFVMAWLPGQRSPIHDHAGSACAVRIVSGHAVEQKYVLNGDGTVTKDGPLSSVGLGDVVGSFDCDIHAFGNAVNAPASPRDILVTIHAYSPPLAPTRKYVEGNRG